MCINCSITVIRFSPQLAWPVYRLIKSDRRIMTHAPPSTLPPPQTHTKAGIEKTSSTAKQIHKNVCMCVSACMFVATTSINKNCLFSFSPSLLRSLYMLFSPFKRCTRPKTGSIAWFSVCTIYAEPANIAAYFLPSLRPLFAAAFDVLCVRFFVCPLLSCAARFRHYVALVDCGSAALRRGRYGKHHVFCVFRACPKPTRRCSSCAIHPTAAQLTTSLPTPTGASAAVIYSVYF